VKDPGQVENLVLTNVRTVEEPRKTALRRANSLSTEEFKRGNLQVERTRLNFSFAVEWDEMNSDL
jgi:hypothetical protein